MVVDFWVGVGLDDWGLATAVGLSVFVVTDAVMESIKKAMTYRYLAFNRRTHHEKHVRFLMDGVPGFHLLLAAWGAQLGCLLLGATSLELMPVKLVTAAMTIIVLSTAWALWRTPMPVEPSQRKWVGKTRFWRSLPSLLCYFVFLVVQARANLP